MPLSQGIYPSVDALFDNFDGASVQLYGIAPPPDFNQKFSIAPAPESASSYAPHTKAMLREWISLSPEPPSAMPGSKPLILPQELIDAIVSPLDLPEDPWIRLVLYFVKSETVQKLLETFKRVDLTKLRSLCLHNTPMNSLLAANASTLETLELRGLFPSRFLENDEPVDVFTGAAQLRVLDLQVPLLADLIPVVRNFGSLRHLVKLHTVVIALVQKAAPAEWTALDLLLGRDDLPALKEVYIRPGSDIHLNPHSHELVRSWMPILAEKGVLRITVDSS
ncbi:hypothetical protein C8F01DRAFT_1372233 [Mycena amicta]|nr:hypothetical protein C8F01DRAFT_1375822 [Mycena amicta]KAJ7056904.1 hypothetical protein C8F01DRAFT_1372233 [Mycena amicta]